MHGSMMQQPLGTTGKMQKNKLREQFRDYRLPAA